MESHPDKHSDSTAQLIYVPHKDTIRLLEVYIKRSLSLDDGSLDNKTDKTKTEKWVTVNRRVRRYSSDPSTHFEGQSDELIGTFSGVEPSEPQIQTYPEESDKKGRKSTKKKSSFWKGFLNFFSLKDNEDKAAEETSPSDTQVDFQPADVSAHDIPCLPTTPISIQRKISFKKKLPKRRHSPRKLSKHRLSRDFSTAGITKVDAVTVEPAYSYYEKVSEELQKIVHEVQDKDVPPLKEEEMIKRIAELVMEEGDILDDKLKENPTLNTFFTRMTYPAFQKLADAYVATEASPIRSLHPTDPKVPPTAPELVKLAFTLDFTARIAAMSRQNIHHITGLGRLYLKDRFEYKQACTDHPWADAEG
ncbi:uncharacterized protein LOC117505861 [Thalassophryne amazonica]|uniref:uncharacterized protein LOC117505861 n=1 Tax=Thalassophryne amazonica TaxID=390379 RepID=UPI0014722649|nr:uncharacterized protein LOC117505861 [Thalassophryne amazonica]